MKHHWFNLSQAKEGLLHYWAKHWASPLCWGRSCWFWLAPHLSSLIWIHLFLTLESCSFCTHLLLLSILERDPPLLLSWRFLPFLPCERVFSISWEFFLIRCEVLGPGCRMCTDCQAHWGKFVVCDIGLYKINWIKLCNKIKKGQVSQAGNTLNHLLTGLVLQAFSLQDLFKGFPRWLKRFTRHIEMLHFTTRELVSIPRTLDVHFNYLSGSSECRCIWPLCPHSSIKGIFPYAGCWFLWERPRPKLTITSL